MSTELVRVTIDERDVHVPKGTGLIETALAAGVEIPVFCYEPRLGAPIGACRMCLVEVDGMPKLQAGCTLTAQDGMKVKTARTSQQAAEGQDATLEFILVNHPLDCPVCDKGGECPLQDLAFRYGPGNTRMSFEKLTFEKPIPISPTISLDRERCILCYRCTRFSESVSEDGQLVAANRGAASVITTFEDLPYTGAFTGNVTELCPVGALLPTQYRFEGRPWEIVEVPTVCGLCPVGCNVHATVREGKVKRILSRNHPEIDEGWICDKGRFAYTHLRAEDRLTEPLRRVRRSGLEPLSWEQAIDEAERLLRAARGRVVTVLSGSETVEQAYALGKLLRVGLDSHQATLPEEISGALDAYRLPLSSIRDADVVVVLGDVPVVERAPVVDLWIKSARRNGARILDDANDPAVAEAERVVLVWSGPGGRGGATVAKLAEKLGLAGRAGCGAFDLPETPNGRGVADAWAACCDEEAEAAESIGLLVVSGDEAAASDDVRALAEQADATIVISMFGGLAAGWADLVLPGTGYLERDGTFVNLEGRLQRLRRTVEAALPRRARVDLTARRAVRRRRRAVHSCRLRRGLGARLRRPRVRRGRRAGATARLSRGAGASRAPGAARAPTEGEARRDPARRLQASLLGCRRRARHGAPVPAASARARALGRRCKTAQDRDRRPRHGRLERQRDHAAGPRQPPLARGHRARRARARERTRRHRGSCEGRGGGRRVNEPWWIALIEALIIVNILLGLFAYLTLVERKLMGRMQLRYGPNRAGPYGLLQPIADLLKLIRKEAFAPSGAIELPYILAPVVSAFTAIAAFAFIPYGPGWTVNGWHINGEIANVSIGLIAIFALGSIGIYGFIVGGWASESKYSILGSMRTCAQLVSYEVSLALSVLGVVMLGRSLNLPEIVARQGSFLPYAIPQLIGLIVFFFAGIAETSRAPFDLPEAEQELVAGYHTEYSGMRWGLFQMAEYINLITISGLMVTLFFAGWHGPWDLGPIWFLLKTMAVLFVFIWLRTTLPRLRYDQLMRFGWKVLLPVATVNAVVTAALVVGFGG